MMKFSRKAAALLGQYWRQRQGWIHTSFFLLLQSQYDWEITDKRFGDFFPTGRITMHAINFGPAATGVEWIKEWRQQKYKTNHTSQRMTRREWRLHSGQVKNRHKKFWNDQRWLYKVQFQLSILYIQNNKKQKKNKKNKQNERSQL